MLNNWSDSTSAVRFLVSGTKHGSAERACKLSHSVIHLTSMRVFKNKWFNRWSRGEDVSDSALYAAAVEIAAGRYDADLGGCLFKKRLARTGGGKSGGYRAILGYKKPNSERIVFLYAFAKSGRANLTDKEEAALSLAAESFLSATDGQVNELLANGSIWEVQHHE